MRRRHFLQWIAGGIASSQASFRTPLKTPQQDGIQHHPPPDDATLKTVEPYPRSTYGGNPIVFEDEWVRHQFAWRTVNDEPRAILHRMRDQADYEVQIDGDSVATPDTHWQAIEPRTAAANQWRLEWRLTTPPRSLGQHEFSIRIQFDEPIVSQSADGSRKVWTGVTELRNTYGVTRPVEKRRCVWYTSEAAKRARASDQKDRTTQTDETESIPFEL